MRQILLVVMMVGACNGRLGALSSSNARRAESADGAAEARLDAAWRGRPVVAMETHPVFSSMEVRRQEVSDGSLIFHHLRCAGWQEPAVVSSHTSAPNPYFGQHTTSVVNGGASGTACCDRQFVVRDGVVQSYRQVAGKDSACTAEVAFYPDGKRPEALAGMR